MEGRSSLAINLINLVKIKGVNLVDNLQYNLLSVSQLCDEGENKLVFFTKDCHVVGPLDKVLIKGKRVGSTYIFYYDSLPSSTICLSSIYAMSRLWHQ